MSTRVSPPGLHPTTRPSSGCGFQQGFSVIETCVSLVILSVLAAWAAPAMARWLDRLGDDFAANFVASLQLARSEAIKTGTRATVCKSSDGSHCSVSGHWGQGWIAFQDDNANGLREPTERVFDVRGAAAGNWSMTGNQSIAHYVSFRSDGVPAQVSGAFQAGTLTLCRTGAPADTGRWLIMSATGRTRLQPVSARTCG
jgi:type IV fimbrial biogenesis protein FimT